MRRAIALALVLGLIGAVSISPALAKKKKPATFKASGAIMVNNPASLEGASITGNEFANTCSIPASQGIDGFVVELSDAISKVTSMVQVSGSDALGTHDLDMYYFSAECAPTGSANSGDADEAGAFPAGTKYVLVNAFLGVQVEFELVATEIR